MTEIVINKERYECPPAVVAYIKQLERNNLNLQEEFYKQGTKIDELKAENARLEELYQKSVGVIAATDCVECKRYDSDVNRAISIIREFCRSNCRNNDECGTCAASKKDGCMFVDYPDEWENLTALIDDGGADNADSGKSV